MKKGFTLIEMLGVLVILSILSLIAIPLVSENINKAREKTYDHQIELILLGAEDYVTDNLLEFQERTKTITLEELASKGYIDRDIKNPKTNTKITGCVVVTAKEKGYNYEYKETC